MSPPSTDKVRAAYSDLATMWTNGFTQMRERFATPRLLRYRGAVRSACGVMGPNKAAYCPRENAIYYDRGVRRRTGEERRVGARNRR